MLYRSRACVYFSMEQLFLSFYFISIYDLDNAHYNYMRDVRHAFIYMRMSVEPSNSCCVSIIKKKRDRSQLLEGSVNK